MFACVSVFLHCRMCFFGVVFHSSHILQILIFDVGICWYLFLPKVPATHRFDVYMVFFATWTCVQCCDIFHNIYIPMIKMLLEVIHITNLTLMFFCCDDQHLMCSLKWIIRRWGVR
jgi:hypothetical protein